MLKTLNKLYNDRVALMLRKDWTEWNEAHKGEGKSASGAESNKGNAEGSQYPYSHYRNNYAEYEKMIPDQNKYYTSEDKSTLKDKMKTMKEDHQPLFDKIKQNTGISLKIVEYWHVENPHSSTSGFWGIKNTGTGHYENIGRKDRVAPLKTVSSAIERHLLKEQKKNA